jgi:hypothetical protein
MQAAGKLAESQSRQLPLNRVLAVPAHHRCLLWSKLIFWNDIVHPSNKSQRGTPDTSSLPRYNYRLSACSNVGSLNLVHTALPVLKSGVIRNLLEWNYVGQRVGFAGSFAQFSNRETKTMTLVTLA